MRERHRTTIQGQVPFPTLGVVVLAALTLASAPAIASAQAATPAATPGAAATLPFAPGDTLRYGARVAKFGRVGTAMMWVEGPTDVRGTPTYVLRFDFRARVGPVKAEEHTASWLDAGRMAALQFHKHERNPLSRSDEHVELFPSERRWQATDGQGGGSPTDAPLDELSFMYFIRTLTLTPDTVYRLERHFDPARNPTTVRVVRREAVATPAGEFATVLLEMRVRDPRRYRGEGVIRINLTDDARRLPVRIESAMPLIGRAVLTLELHACAPRQQLLAQTF